MSFASAIGSRGRFNGRPLERAGMTGVCQRAMKLAMGIAVIALLLSAAAASADPEAVVLALPNEAAACRYIAGLCDRVTSLGTFGGTDALGRMHDALSDLWKAAAVMRGKYGSPTCLAQCKWLRSPQPDASPSPSN
jgi:hypothetical protein